MLRYPWLKQADPHHSYMGDNSALRRSYLPEEYRRDTALHNIVATVHIEAECDRTQQVAETRWLSGLAACHGMPNAIVAHAWIDTPDTEEVLLQHKQWPLVRGIRTKPIISEGPDGSVRGSPGAWTPSGAMGCRCWRSTTYHGTRAWCGGTSRRPLRSCASTLA